MIKRLITSLFMMLNFIIYGVYSTKIASNLSKVRVYNKKPRAILNVVGRSSRKVESDVIKIQITVTTLNELAYLSIQENSIISQELANRLTSFGFDNKNITTINFSLHPKYNFTANQQIFIGYETRNSLQMTMSDLDLAGKILDSISNISGMEINSVFFEVSKEKEKQIKDSLIKEAILDAEKIARLTLKQTKNEVKSVKSISIQSYGMISTIPQYGFQVQSEAAAMPTLYGGKQDVSLTVLETFWIGPNNK